MGLKVFVIQDEQLFKCKIFNLIYRNSLMHKYGVITFNAIDHHLALEGLKSWSLLTIYSLGSKESNYMWSVSEVLQRYIFCKTAYLDLCDKVVF